MLGMNRFGALEFLLQLFEDPEHFFRIHLSTPEIK